MQDISMNINTLTKELGSDICLVAVSKTKPPSLIMKAYLAGQRDFGENKVQELQAKAEELPKDIRWHMIGHLQSNKVKYIAPFVNLIHSVDKLKLLIEINKRAAQNKRIINILLQVHIASENTKFGMNEEELRELLQSDSFQQMKNVKVLGLMGMATFTDNKDLIKKEFEYLKSLFLQTNKQYFASDSDFKVLSMGMSGDYPIAVEAGSNMVRIGSAIFGER